MKLFVVLAVFITLAAAKPQVSNFVYFLNELFNNSSLFWQDKQGRIFLECAIENGISLEQIMEIDAQKIKPKDVPENFKCFPKCYMVKNEWMDAEGNMNEKAFVDQLADHDKEKMSRAFKNCENKITFADRADPCLVAYKMFTCFDDYRYRKN